MTAVDGTTTARGRRGPRAAPFVRLVRTEARLFLREPMAVLWALVFPPVLLVILGCVPSFRERSADLHGLRVIDLYVPIMVIFVVAMTAVNVLPATITSYREKGILRRLSTTPLPPSRLLLAQVVLNVVLETLVLVLVVAVGRIGFGVALPKQPVAYAIVFACAVLALLALGMVIAAVSPNAKVGNALGMILFFPLMFFAGLWLPVAAMPAVLRRIAEYTPVGAATQALGQAAAGDWPNPVHLLVLVGYAVVFSLVAIRFFRWE
ncbi:ABC transporter permease [Actinocatenispora rupis]|uniref:Transport permease protein n=1 Tax=Actinocatenispora rupis TaxID=519421 RepID=A0A8J3NBF1_9ACTN|nr:ABC transporter permease [Actinocatenispora rupis]GID10597.1 transport permease protein [Actinocatenispora rupis]